MANRLTTQKNKIPKHKKPAVVKVVSCNVSTDQAWDQDDEDLIAFSQSDNARQSRVQSRVQSKIHSKVHYSITPFDDVSPPIPVSPLAIGRGVEKTKSMTSVSVSSQQVDSLSRSILINTSVNAIGRTKDGVAVNRFNSSSCRTTSQMNKLTQDTSKSCIRKSSQEAVMKRDRELRLLKIKELKADNLLKKQTLTASQLQLPPPSEPIAKKLKAIPIVRSRPSAAPVPLRMERHPYAPYSATPASDDKLRSRRKLDISSDDDIMAAFSASQARYRRQVVLPVAADPVQTRPRNHGDLVALIPYERCFRRGDIDEEIYAIIGRRVLDKRASSMATAKLGQTTECGSRENVAIAEDEEAGTGWNFDSTTADKLAETLSRPIEREEITSPPFPVATKCPASSATTTSSNKDSVTVSFRSYDSALTTQSLVDMLGVSRTSQRASKPRSSSAPKSKSILRIAEDYYTVSQEVVNDDSSTELLQAIYKTKVENTLHDLDEKIFYDERHRRHKEKEKLYTTATFKGRYHTRLSVVNILMCKTMKRIALYPDGMDMEYHLHSSFLKYEREEVEKLSIDTSIDEHQFNEEVACLMIPMLVKIMDKDLDIALRHWLIAILTRLLPLNALLRHMITCGDLVPYQVCERCSFLSDVVSLEYRSVLEKHDPRRLFDYLLEKSNPIRVEWFTVLSLECMRVLCKDLEAVLFYYRIESWIDRFDIKSVKVPYFSSEIIGDVRFALICSVIKWFTFVCGKSNVVFKKLCNNKGGCILRALWFTQFYTERVNFSDLIRELLMTILGNNYQGIYRLINKDCKCGFKLIESLIWILNSEIKRNKINTLFIKKINMLNALTVHQMAMKYCETLNINYANLIRSFQHKFTIDTGTYIDADLVPTSLKDRLNSLHEELCENVEMCPRGGRRRTRDTVALRRAYSVECDGFRHDDFPTTLRYHDDLRYRTFNPAEFATPLSTEERAARTAYLAARLTEQKREQARLRLVNEDEYVSEADDN